MEEQSGAHMESGLSSTIEDVQEVQGSEGKQGAGANRDVETVVTVESVKEEDMQNNKPPPEAKTVEKKDVIKISPKLAQNQDATIKKIVIKCPFGKDIHIQQQIHKSPIKPDDIKKITDKNMPANKAAQPSVSNKSESSVNTSNKQPPKKGVENNTNKSTVNSDVQKPVQKSPVKDSPEVVAAAKEVSTPSPNKENQPKEQAVGTPTETKKPETAKPATTHKIIAKEVSSKEVLTPVKESPAKETTSKTVETKEQPAKPTSSKEQKFTAGNAEKLNKTTEEKVENKSETDSKNKNVPTMEDKEISNDSQVETSSDISEKEHNRSISRELRSLINSAKESKIISECTQLTSKTRKSRTPLDTSITGSTTAEADKIQGVRRGSDNSQLSTCSEPEKVTTKRSMRSQNPEFVSKVKNFLNSVSGKGQKVEEISDDEADVKSKEKEKTEKEIDKEATPTAPKKKKVEESVMESPNKLRSDAYCWRCHWAVDPIANEKSVTHSPLHCSVCPRSFHYKCLTSVERNKISMEKSWVCPECQLILQAESSESRSPAMKKISLGMLCDLLKHALDRMLEVNGVEPFTSPVDRSAFPDYDKYVVHPMDLGRMRELINEGQYGSTEAFLSDAQWILHNSIIFNTLQAKLTGGARALVRSCRAEMSEIEACPECYAAAHARRSTWFTDVCSTPHILLWAKLKGFPYWPAKGMSVNSASLVDVRFFGAHDRAWVPARDCFLYSEKDPNNFRTKRQDILDSMQEAEQHIRNISRKYGQFVYPPFKTPFDPTKLNEQIKLMIPTFEGEVRTPLKDKSTNSSPSVLKEKNRSNSKSSKGSFNDGYMSEGDDVTVRSRKMADGAEIAREDEDFSMDKDKTMEIDVPQTKEADVSKKRRRSDLEEAVITIIDTSKDKRRKVDSADKSEDKSNAKDANKESQEQKTKDTSKSKDGPSTSTGESSENKTAKPNNIRVISISKVLKQGGKVSPKVVKEDEKTPVAKPKAKLEKSNSTEKEKSTPQEDKKAKRRNSKNKSFNNSNVGKDKTLDKKNEKGTDTPNKEKANSTGKNTESDKIVTSTPNAKSKDAQFDDDTSLAVLARGNKNNSANLSGLPTISSVRSLSVPQKTNGKSADTEEASSDSSIFTPTSTENVKNMKEAVNKLQRLRGENEPPPPVGRVGVRAFARMTSPPDRETRPNNDVQVEIKAEPMDFEDSERVYQEKMDLMNAFKLRPVNPAQNLRDVRINKVVVTPVARKTPAQAQPAPTRAKKTFPQPKKTDEGRSELTSKNSMVYIPIQPPTTQAPVRPPRPNAAITVVAQQQPRVMTPCNTTLINSTVNTITPPMVANAMGTLSSPSTSMAPTSNSSTPGVMTVGPTVGQVPTTVHTMPLITSVNGQWTFSLQPVLSVGGVDGAASPPMVNGIGDRPALVPIAPAPNPALVPAASTLAQNTVNNNSRTGENQLGEPPRLQQRPSLMHPLDSNAPMGTLPPPSTVGPLTAKLNQNAVKLTDFFRTLLEDSLDKLDEPAAQVTAIKLRLEQLQWRHQQEISEIKHNHELVITEMRSSFEKEKSRLLAETRRQTQVELDAAVKHAKSKQWCANCNQEAQFYCCWNTSYCDYPCQRAHWTQHYAVCTQQRAQDSNNSDNTNSPDRLPPPPETLTKTSAAPNLTVGGKLAPSRVYTQEQLPQKSSIIVSMVEDGTGNQTMKCLGTYKGPNGPPQNMSPLILNKQIMTSEEAAKKVVTSGGYLIVGATNSVPNSTTITTTRRAHAIQYIS